MEKMKQMTGKTKAMIIIGAIVAVAAVAAIIIAVVMALPSGYRQIKIYQVKGTATLEREKIGEMDAYENLAMQENDLLKVAQQSSVRLQMDEDKYALAEANTVLSITAEGKGDKTRTDIDLQQGAVTIEIQNKLSEGSTYQVTTPNSVMAVRGTVFRVAVTTDENGKPKTKLDVFEGSVAINKVTVNEKGETVVSKEEFVTEKGQQIIVYITETEGEDGEDSEIIIEVVEEPEYDDIPEDTLIFLKEVIVENQRELNLTEEEIDLLLGAIAETILPTEPAVETPAESTEATEDSATDTAAETSGAEEVAPTESAVTEESTETTTSAEAIVTDTASEEDDDEEETTSEASEETTEETSTEEETPETEEVPAEYTVTFQYDGKVFGTQVVAAGELATEPKLKPAAAGSWDFDFTKPIEKDTVIEFK